MAFLSLTLPDPLPELHNLVRQIYLSENEITTINFEMVLDGIMTPYSFSHTALYWNIINESKFCKQYAEFMNIIGVGWFNTSKDACFLLGTLALTVKHQ